MGAPSEGYRGQDAGIGPGPPFLKISYTLVNYPTKALIRVRHQMKRTREVRGMLCGLTSDDESSCGEG